MASQNRVTANRQTASKRRRSKLKTRKISFEGQRWYAEIARTMSAVKKSSEQRLAEVNAGPLAAE